LNSAGSTGSALERGAPVSEVTRGPPASLIARAVPADAIRAPADAWAAGAAAHSGPFEHSANARVPARSPWWLEALAIAWLCWLYDMINGLAPMRAHAALVHAWAVLHLERALHLDPELALNRWLVPHHALALLLSDYYDNAHFVVTLGVLGWLWLRRPDGYRPLRSTLVLINVFGLAVFWLYPMAPPRMLPGVGFSDVVALTHAFGSWHTGSLAADADQFAAMPSLHMAWAAWCVLVVWWATERRWVRALAGGHLALTCVAVLATGNHFLADVLAGLATTAVAFWCVKSATDRSLGRRLMAALALPQGFTRTLVPALEPIAQAHGQGGGQGDDPAGKGHDNPRDQCHKVVTKSNRR
jgi:hypothetical protein